MDEEALGQIVEGEDPQKNILQNWQCLNEDQPPKSDQAIQQKLSDTDPPARCCSELSRQ